MPARCPHDLRESGEICATEWDSLTIRWLIQAPASIRPHRNARYLTKAAHSAPKSVPVSPSIASTLSLKFEKGLRIGVLWPHASVPVWAVPARATVANSLLGASIGHLWFERSCSALAMQSILNSARVPLPAAQTVRILHEFAIRGFGEHLVTRCG
jgi:hypothetical protein